MTRVGIFSDSHGDHRALDELLLQMGRIDAACFLGDIARDAAHLEERLAPMPQHPPLFAVHGNNDHACAQPDERLVELGGVRIYMTHGHHFNDQNLPKIANPRTILLHGHTHVPVNLHHVTHRTMNPGSTTIPKQESPRSYMLIDGTHIYWKHLEDGSVYMEDVL